MLGFQSQFSFAAAVALATAITTAVAATVVWVRRRRAGSPPHQVVATTLAIGWAGVVVAATALPRSWPPVWEGRGDLVLTPGRGGLSDWRVLFDDPNSLAAVLLVANVVLYIPLGLFTTLHFRGSAVRAIAACCGLASAIELVQLGFLARVASLDDLILNALGAGAGAVGARIVLDRSHATPRVGHLSP